LILPSTRALPSWSVVVDIRSSFPSEHSKSNIRGLREKRAQPPAEFLGPSYLPSSRRDIQRLEPDLEYRQPPAYAKGSAFVGASLDAVGASR